MKTFYEYPFTTRARNTLTRCGITTVEQMQEQYETGFLARLRGVGTKTLLEIKAALEPGCIAPTPEIEPAPVRLRKLEGAVLSLMSRLGVFETVDSKPLAPVERVELLYRALATSQRNTAVHTWSELYRRP